MRLFYGTIFLLLAISVLMAQPVSDDSYETALPPVKMAIKDLNFGSNATVRLRYSGDYGNYLRFYDERGTVVVLAFRRHRWDYTNNHFLKELRLGQPYEVVFRYEAQRIAFPEPYAPIEQVIEKSEPKANSKAIREAETYILGRIISYRSAVLNDLRF
ncbi:MAG: hypothetical protein N2246_08530 [Candidatus Sumerlaeia bacterium]|nr:hypothetical protein [Candidatus Sumerlaeia bacterium]